MGEGETYGVGTSPAGALAHLPCCHTKGDTIRVGFKDGGERGEDFFFPYLVWGLCAVALDGPTWAAREVVWRMGGLEGGLGEGEEL